MLRIGQSLPDISLNSTEGNIKSHEYFKGSWGLLVCYVANFSAVCTDEMRQLVQKFHEFENRNVKILSMSCDSIHSHIKWIKDLKVISGLKNDEQFPFPIVSDINRMFSLYLNILDENCTDKYGISLPCRATFVFTPEMTIGLIHLYPQTVGRNFDEVLRSIDALQLTTKFNNELFISSDWKPNTNCLVSSEVSNEDIENKFSSSTIIELPSKQGYMRIIPEKDLKN